MEQMHTRWYPQLARLLRRPLSLSVLLSIGLLALLLIVPQPSVNAQTALFTRVLQFTEHVTAWSAGDVDGDGQLDMAAIGATSGAVHLNLASGLFYNGPVNCQQTKLVALFRLLLRTKYPARPGLWRYGRRRRPGRGRLHARGSGRVYLNSNGYFYQGEEGCDSPAVQARIRCFGKIEKYQGDVPKDFAHAG